MVFSFKMAFQNLGPIIIHWIIVGTSLYIIDIRNCQAIPFRKSTRTLYRIKRAEVIMDSRRAIVSLYDEAMLLDDGNDMVLSVLSCQCTAWAALVVMRMTE